MHNQERCLHLELCQTILPMPTVCIFENTLTIQLIGGIGATKRWQLRVRKINRFFYQWGIRVAIGVR